VAEKTATTEAAKIGHTNTPCWPTKLSRLSKTANRHIHWEVEIMGTRDWGDRYDEGPSRQEKALLRKGKELLSGLGLRVIELNFNYSYVENSPTPGWEYTPSVFGDRVVNEEGVRRSLTKEVARPFLPGYYVKSLVDRAEARSFLAIGSPEELAQDVALVDAFIINNLEPEPEPDSTLRLLMATELVFEREMSHPEITRQVRESGFPHSWWDNINWLPNQLPLARSIIDRVNKPQHILIDGIPIDEDVAQSFAGLNIWSVYPNKYWARLAVERLAKLGINAGTQSFLG